MHNQKNQYKINCKQNSCLSRLCNNYDKLLSNVDMYNYELHKYKYCRKFFLFFINL